MCSSTYCGDEFQFPMNAIVLELCMFLVCAGWEMAQSTIRVQRSMCVVIGHPGNDCIIGHNACLLANYIIQLYYCKYISGII